jgi:hypothetical protein
MAFLKMESDWDSSIIGMEFIGLSSSIHVRTSTGTLESKGMKNSHVIHLENELCSLRPLWSDGRGIDKYLGRTLQVGMSVTKQSRRDKGEACFRYQYLPRLQRSTGSSVAPI